MWTPTIRGKHSRADNQIGFAVTARRWVVEHSFAGINRNRRLTKDFGATIEGVEAFLSAVSSVIMLRTLARGTTDPIWA